MKINKCMVTIVAAAVSLLIVFALTGCQSEGSSEIDWDNHEKRAEQFVMALVNGDYDIAAAGFDAAMNRASGVWELKKSWEDTVIKKAGAFVTIVKTEIVPHDEYEIYEVSSRHEKAGITTRVVFSSDGLVAGLYFVPFVED